MQENVGGLDRTARTMGGPALVALALGPLGARRGRLVGPVTLVAGALVTETAITRVCPATAARGVEMSR